LTGQREEPNANWNWLLSWDSNQAAGAMPSPPLLRVARLSAVLAAALSVVLFYWLASEIIGAFPALVAAVLLAIHPLELLHARRAMAEATLQLFSMLAVLVIVRVAGSGRRDRPEPPSLLPAVAAGIAIGLAVSSKQNAIALVPLGLVAVAAAAMESHASMRRRLIAAPLHAGVFVVSSLLIFFVANPVTFSQPLRAGRLMISMRRSLATTQAANLEMIGSDATMPTTLARLNAAYRELFWNPPNLNESATYAELAPNAQAYQRRPLVVWSNQRWLRLLLLALSVFGLGITVRTIVRDRFGAHSRPMQIVVLWLLAEVAFVALFIPMDWQRYFLPLLPPVCILAALGMSWLTERVLPRRRADVGHGPAKAGHYVRQAGSAE
jgi:4-amino-4-deoxy-L-arabinose transferase-like glycosyltransferase